MWCSVSIGIDIAPIELSILAELHFAASVHATTGIRVPPVVIVILDRWRIGMQYASEAGRQEWHVMKMMSW